MDESARLIHRRAVPPAIGFFTSIAAVGGFLAFTSVHAEAVWLARTSIPLFVYGIVVVSCRIASAKVRTDSHRCRWLRAALAAIAAGLAVLALWTTPTGDGCWHGAHCIGHHIQYARVLLGGVRHRETPSGWSRRDPSPPSLSSASAVGRSCSVWSFKPPEPPCAAQASFFGQ